MLELLQNWLVDSGMGITSAAVLARSVLAAAVILLSAIADFVAHRLLLDVLTRIIKRTKTTWDNTFLEKKVFNRLSHLAPAIVIILMAPLALEGYPDWIELLTGLASIYMIVVALLVIDSFLNAVLDIYRSFPISRRIPIKGFIQVLKMVTVFIAAIVIISTVLGQTPVVLLSGLGAFAAVLILVFKDPILGFVAGIQLTANKMVARGDWIEMPKYSADGDVLDVTLTTVKVQNWDKTISYIPTSALVTNTFRNWRGMNESGGRRIKRAVNVDMGSIKFCDEAMLEKFSKIQYIAEYIAKKKEELAAHNEALQVDGSTWVNGRHLTNVGTFRAYVVAYLKQHPLIHQEMTFLVRQLPPSPQGLPIEIYVFSKDQVWANYEAIQADIFDHILAVAPEFELRVFQNPSGHDFRSLV